MLFYGCRETHGGVELCGKEKVGCVIVKDNRICSIGFNGQPSGFPNVCEYTDENGELKTYDTVIHAEASAIYWCAKTNTMTDGATAFITLSPCKQCALVLIQAGIKRVVYCEDYWNPNKDGLDLLRKSGIAVEKLDANAVKMS